uniref:Exocyst complex component Sec3 PIP2-binding N-terminal domain-containing protein n=1 Tax=Panagrolaimus sp. JU765 TaxID=591449 RepID=A0AC34QVY9_9BILA
MMSALRLTLQKTLFQPDEERLIDVVQIAPQDGKRHKKEAFLCLAMTVEQPFSVRLYIVKTDRDKLKKRMKFALRDVRVVDGINPRKAIPEFTMKILEQEFVLVSSTYEEKEKFIRQLYKFANQYLPVHKPEFVNIQLPVDLVPISQISEHSEAVITENLPISAKEEADFRNLLSKANLTIGDAKKFANLLNERLLELDGANIESIMGNEQAVTSLISLTDDALDEVAALEKQLDDMDNILSYVRDSVELIEEKDSLGQVERQNTERLRKELEEFLFHLDTISDDHIKVLRDARLSDPSSINQCCTAARAMNHFLNKKTELTTMSAYQSRVAELNVVRNEFVDKLFSHVSALFDNMEMMVDDQEWDVFTIKPQTQRYRALSPFSELIYWLKSTNATAYSDAIRRYVTRAEALYRKEFKRFFAAINQKVSTELLGRKDAQSEKEYISLLETIIGESRNTIEAEQKFCVRFFHISADLLSAVETRSSESGDSAGAFGGVKNAEKQFNDQVKSVIQPIFCSFLPGLSEFIELCSRQNNLVLLVLYVTLSKKMQSHQDSGSYFSVIYGSTMILFKQKIDQLMQEVSNSFESYRPPKKVRVGILPIIEQYENLAKHCEVLFSNSERKADLEKWHEKLVDSLFKGINAVAESPNSKAPASIVRLENFHQLYLTLSELKIKCLDGRRAEAKELKNINIDNYVREYMGRPLEKIHIFFEQVEKAIESGVKPEEISYQQQFSRIELKKVINAYPGKEVKKGLENLYRKLVEKHLVSGSLLVEVVWRRMQEEFLNQLKVYSQIMAKCYPNARIDLEVTIGDVLTYFSDIAQQH